MSEILFNLALICRNLSSLPRSELKKAVAVETATKEAVHITLTAAQTEYVEIEQTDVAVC